MVDRRAFSFGTMSFALDVFTDASSLNVASVPYEMIGTVTYFFARTLPRSNQAWSALVDSG